MQLCAARLMTTKLPNLTEEELTFLAASMDLLKARRRIGRRDGCIAEQVVIGSC